MQAPLGHPFFLPLAVLPLFSMRRILTPRCAACGSMLLWIRIPFFWSYVLVPVLVYAREVPAQGRTDVLSRPRLPVSSSIAFDISSLLPCCSVESFCTRAPDVFSRSRLRTTSSSLRNSPTLLLCTGSRRASMVRMDTVFGATRAVAQFEARTWFSGCRRTDPCCHASTRWIT